MAKKQKKKHKKKDGTDPSPHQTGKEIVDLWKGSFKDGLSGLPGRTLDPKIAEKYEPMLTDFVAKKLKGGDVFTKDDEKCTKQVAKDLGKICRMLTTNSKTVTLDIFDPAFLLVQRFHDVCMSAGGGAWCGGGA